MAHTNVSSCVSSIVGSFANSLDVFKRLRERRGRRKHTKANQQVIAEEELNLTRSLRQGPEDIGREYQRSAHAAGEHFAVGDAIAQTSLAEVILRLNTGLVTIIASFLKRDKRDVQLDYQSLTTLSEQSRIDTCRTLRQLFRRMHRVQQKTCPPSGLLSQCREPTHANNSDVIEKERKRKPATKHRTKIRGPMLARVVIQDSSKPSQIAMVKPGDGRKSKPSSPGVYSRADSAVDLVTSTPSLPPYRAVEEIKAPSRAGTDRSDTIPEDLITHNKKPLAASLEPKMSRHGRSTLRPRASQCRPQLKNPPPLAATVPLVADETKKQKKEPEKHYSFVSASTKLGEIPLHKWPEPFDFDAMSLMNRDAERSGWPQTQRDDQGRKKRVGLFRLFKKKDETV